MPVRVGLRVIEKWNESLENQVRKYEEEPIQKGQIVFYGSSTFTRWKRERWDHTPLSEALPGKSGKPCCINRGFGSSNAEQQLYYYPRMIRPLEPKVLVYYGFGNYKGFGYSMEETWELMQRVIMYALTDFPDIHVYLASQIPKDFSTEEAVASIEKSNALLKEFAEKTPNCFYLDITGVEALHREEYYVADHVHFNQAGYDLYAEYYKEALKEELDRY